MSEISEIKKTTFIRIFSIITTLCFLIIAPYMFVFIYDKELFLKLDLGRLLLLCIGYSFPVFILTFIFTTKAIAPKLIEMMLDKSVPITLNDAAALSCFYSSFIVALAFYHAIWMKDIFKFTTVEQGFDSLTWTQIFLIFLTHLGAWLRKRHLKKYPKEKVAPP